MTETPNHSRRWQITTPSITASLAIALSLSLIFSSYLLVRLNSDRKNSTHIPSLPTPTNSTIIQPGQLNLQAGSTPFVNSDLDVLMAQLQDTQSRLNALSGQLEQKSMAAGLPPYGSAAATYATGDDPAVLWDEIEELYQLMQPLMAQVEAASASPSSRPASELIALRTQVNTIHQRLAVLLSRVQAANARSDTGNRAGWAQWTTQTPIPAVSDQAMLNQLYQNMTEMQAVLQQMQGQLTSP